MDEKYRTALRGFIARKGVPVQFDENDRARFPDSPNLWVSSWGWRDHSAWDHSRTCPWVVDPGVKLTEIIYHESTDTYDEGNDVTGINVEPSGTADIRCSCGQYSNVVLRWEGSLTEAIQDIFGPSDSGSIHL